MVIYDTRIKKDPKLFWVNFLNLERGVKALQNLTRAIKELDERTQMTDNIKTSDDLKPCPFCGCDPSCTSVYNESNGANDILFGCHNQDCIGPYTDDFCSCEETESYIADLSKQWNTRYEGKIKMSDMEMIL